MPKLLFVTLSSFYPDSVGGGELSANSLLQKLKEQGWEIEVVCGIRRQMKYAGQFLWQCLKAFIHCQPFSSFIKEDTMDYRCWRNFRGRYQELDEQVRQFVAKELREYQPDVVLSDSCVKSQKTQISLLHTIAQRGHKAFYFVRNVDEIASGKLGNYIPDSIYVIANGYYSASVVRKWTRNEVGIVFPFINKKNYQVTSRNRKYITFINPVPVKGGYVAAEIAKLMPERKFLFIKGKWPTYLYRKTDSYMKLIYDLPNVEVWECQNDMRRVYSVTDILLYPSQFMETSPRAIIEAHINGIPVVAANHHGIPYILGEGGILVSPPGDPTAYASALRKMQNENLYQKLSLLAYENSRREEFDFEVQVQAFTNFVKKHANLNGEI